MVAMEVEVEVERGHETARSLLRHREQLSKDKLEFYKRDRQDGA